MQVNRHTWINHLVRTRCFWLALLTTTFALHAQAPNPASKKAESAPPEQEVKLGDPVPEPTTLEPSAIEKYLKDRVQRDQLVGLSIAICKDGKLFWSKAFGKKSRESNHAANDQTRFAAGSVTKQFTCAAILKLAEQKKLSIDDPVAKYYPHLTSADRITLYDLMSHLSGYHDYYPLDFVDRRLAKPIAPDDLIKEYAGGKLDFEPRSRYSYSNTGYTILGRVIEKVSGQTFAQYLAENFFKPAGMNDAVLDPGTDCQQCATGYTSWILGDIEPAIPEASGWLYAAGGLFAPASDLAKWNLALMDGKLVDPKSFALMYEPRTLSTGLRRNYGCGLTVAYNNGETVVTHSGAISGFRAYNTMLPRTKSALTVMCNAEHADSVKVYQVLLNLLIKATEVPTLIPKVKGVSAVEAAKALIKQFQAGKVDRSMLADEYSAYLSEERLKQHADRLKAWGDPVEVSANPPGERGGLEVVSFRIVFKDRTVGGLMYRQPDGKIEEFLITR